VTITLKKYEISSKDNRITFFSFIIQNMSYTINRRHFRCGKQIVACTRWFKLCSPGGERLLFLSDRDWWRRWIKVEENGTNLCKVFVHLWDGGMNQLTHFVCDYWVNRIIFGKQQQLKKVILFFYSKVHIFWVERSFQDGCWHSTRKPTATGSIPGVMAGLG